MQPRPMPRWDGIEDLADATGLLDQHGVYKTEDHAELLRLCALQVGESTDARIEMFAEKAFSLLASGRKYDGSIQHCCDQQGQWYDTFDDDAVTQAVLARALAVATESELDVELRIATGEWLDSVMQESYTSASLAAYAYRLLAWAAMDESEAIQYHDLAESWAEELANAYCLNSNLDWHWFEPTWSKHGLAMAMAMWVAAERLGWQRNSEIAEEATQFVLDHFFEDGLCMPAGNNGTWSQGREKPVFDQSSTDVANVVELLCTAGRVSWMPKYSDYAELAARWFSDNNLRGESLIDPVFGGCQDAMRQYPDYAPITPAASIAAMVAHESLHQRTVIITEPTIVVR